MQMIEFPMLKNEFESEDPKGTFQSSITHELTSNPFCPIPDLINEALQIGDVELANQIASESLTPKLRKPSLRKRLRSIFKH